MAKLDKRAQAVALFVGGTRVSEIARQLGVSKSTVSMWVRGLTGPPELAKVERDKVRDHGEAVGEYLAELLTTVKAQAIHARDPKWLTRQNAADFAICHGVLVDKGIALYAAAERYRVLMDNGVQNEGRG